LPTGPSVVAKSAGPDGTLDIEAFMLGYLAQHSRLPVPRVLHASPSLLVMESIDGESRFSASAEVHAAELLADLHGISAPRFGLDRGTLIGPLSQPNTQSASWIDFSATNDCCTWQKSPRLPVRLMHGCMIGCGDSPTGSPV
jgi:fructosamine-3-kinase